MKNITKLVLIAAVAVLASCGGEKNGGQSMSAYLSSFLFEDNTIVAYGSTDVNDIIGKADLVNLPMVGAMVGESVEDMNAVMTPDSKLYYAFEGPFDRKGNPKHSYIFLDVKNADSLKSKLEGMGYSFEEKNGLQISAQDDKVIGIKNDLAIGVQSNYKMVDADKMIADAFKRADRKKSNPQVEEVLEDDADIVLGSNLQALYATSDTDLEDLNEDQKAKIKSYVDGSQYKTTVRFEKGEAIIETKALVNDKLREALFLKEEDNKNVLSKLGPGTPKAAIAINLDLKKMQKLAEDLSPGVMDKLYGELGIPSIVMSGLGPDGVGSVINGQLGFALTGTMDKGGEIPQVAGYLGLGDNAGMVTDMGEGMLEMNGAKASNGVYSYEGMKLRLTDDYVVVNTSGDAVDDAKFGYTPVTLPVGAKNFGKKPISGFIDMKAMAGEEAFMMEVGDLKQAVNIIDFIYFEADNLDSKLIIKAKEGNENILKQIVTSYMNELK